MRPPDGLCQHVTAVAHVLGTDKWALRLYTGVDEVLSDKELSSTLIKLFSHRTWVKRSKGDGRERNRFTYFSISSVSSFGSCMPYHTVFCFSSCPVTFSVTTFIVFTQWESNTCRSFPFLSFSLSSHPRNSHLLAIVTKPRHFMKSHNYPQKQMGRNLWSPPLCSLAAVISRMKSFVLQADGYSDWQRVSVNKQTVILLYSLYSPLSPRMILLQTKARMRTRGWTMGLLG